MNVAQQSILSAEDSLIFLKLGTISKFLSAEYSGILEGIPGEVAQKIHGSQTFKGLKGKLQNLELDPVFSWQPVHLT